MNLAVNIGNGSEITSFQYMWKSEELDGTSLIFRDFP